MKAPIFSRPLTKDEHEQIQAGLRSTSTFCPTMQPDLAGIRARRTCHRDASTLGCDNQTVRDAIKGFNERGLAILQRGSSRS